MWVICESLLDDGKKEAKKMLSNGETIRSVPFGGKNDIIFVSTDPEPINATAYFIIEGVTFYLGWKKKSS